MHRYVLIGCLILGNVSCYFQQAQTDKPPASIPSMSNSNATIEPPNTDLNELVESFSDESQVGVPHKNKIEINDYNRSKSNRAVVKFYSLTNKNEWELKQSFDVDIDRITNCDPRIEDFNNDGFKDVTFVSDEASRGANEIRTLFIYSKKNDEIVYIKNSADYPNLEYNSRLNCLTAWRVYGGTATDFLRLRGDVLEEFASVENFPPNRTVIVRDHKGNEKVIRRDKITDDDLYTRYISFKPLD